MKAVDEDRPEQAIEERRGGPARAAIAMAAVVAAVAAVAVGAQVDVAIPGTPVPQSLQTLAVVVVGGALGLRVGALALIAYLVAGAVGLPVFAGGASGLEALGGPTAGYLAGFVLGAAAMGWWADRGWASRFAAAFGGAVVAHAVILLAGWSWLALDIGAGAAWSGGVAPFLVGGVVKSAVAAGLLAFTPIGRGGGAGLGRVHDRADSR
ncbi:biotin transporter BioY [Gaopeijia maritima]|uniref:biotin transporter BioY n=1 Tax=Gaopeijia maritima TaxID=3119007 RepID=UPI003253F9EB